MKRGCPLCVRSISEWLVIRILCHCERSQKHEANKITKLGASFVRWVCTTAGAVLAPSA